MSEDPKKHPSLAPGAVPGPSASSPVPKRGDPNDWAPEATDPGLRAKLLKYTAAAEKRSRTFAKTLTGLVLAVTGLITATSTLAGRVGLAQRGDVSELKQKLHDQEIDIYGVKTAILEANERISEYVVRALMPQKKEHKR